MRSRIIASFVALAAAASVFVNVPAASADGLSNPSGTLTVECAGAKAFLQVDWKAGDRVTIRWRVDDTGTASGISPPCCGSRPTTSTTRGRRSSSPRVMPTTSTTAATAPMRWA
ncbi:hypothetical protein [Nonomuraea salmonea]|uniref:hypothetical protein n=1 Tax=Nonomuraea salmonea TaxID=46181 RepID=UPI002FEC3BD0